MIADISMALVVSLSFQLFSVLGKTIKHVIIALGCITVIVTYFCTGNTLNFIGTMDFGIWVLFVIVFSTILSLIEQRLVRFFKDKEQKSKIC